MSHPLDKLQKALVEASNELAGTPDFCEDVEEMEIRREIDTKIDEALELVRTWRERVEGES